MDKTLSISCTKCICTTCDRKDSCIYRPCNIEDISIIHCKWVKETCKLKDTNADND